MTIPLRPRTGPGVVTAENADAWVGQAGFGQFQKKGTTRISLRPVPAGTSFQTPEGLRAEDEECRIAFDVQGGVYPIRESVFQRSYIEAEAAPDLSANLNALWDEWILFDEQAAKRGSGFTRDQMNGAAAFHSWIVKRLREPSREPGEEG